MHLYGWNLKMYPLEVLGWMEYVRNLLEFPRIKISRSYINDAKKQNTTKTPQRTSVLLVQMNC